MVAILSLQHEVGESVWSISVPFVSINFNVPSINQCVAMCSQIVRTMELDDMKIELEVVSAIFCFLCIIPLHSVGHNHS